MTEFAVATVKQAEKLHRIESGSQVSIGRVSIPRAWALKAGVLTDAGRLALELREALGPDRGLTRAGAKGLLKGGATRATRLRLMNDGLWKRSYILGIEDAWLTEDGLKVREILRKYKAEL